MTPNSARARRAPRRLLYFAYGSNLRPAQMAARCPGARAVGPAALDGYRLAFRGFSPRWGGAVATIVRRRGACVLGMLYELEPEDLARLDVAEGHPIVYERVARRVRVRDGRRRVLTYVLSGIPGETAPPSIEYARAILEGYREHGLDERPLLRALAGFAHDPDEALGEGERRIFVYGTLMRGEPLAHAMKDARFLGYGRTARAWWLYSLGSYPALVGNGRLSVTGEVYAVRDDLVERLDRIEGHPTFYRRSALQLADGADVEAYVLQRPPTGAPLIMSGSWRLRG